MKLRVDKLMLRHMPDSLVRGSQFVPVEFLILSERCRPAEIVKGIAFHFLVAVV